MLVKIKLIELKELIKDLLKEAAGPSGALRRVRGAGGQQYKIGKVEDENRELSSFEAEQMFPGSVVAWTEIVPELFPDYPFHDPFSIKKHSLWFKIGNELRVAFSEMPSIELAQWKPEKDDWVELDPS